MEIQKMVCWSCGSDNSAQTPAGDYENHPDTDDISICAYCGAISLYVRNPSGLSVRTPSPTEHRELLSRPEVQEALETWRRQWKPEWALGDTVN